MKVVMKTRTNRTVTPVHKCNLFLFSYGTLAASFLNSGLLYLLKTTKNNRKLALTLTQGCAWLLASSFRYFSVIITADNFSTNIHENTVTFASVVNTGRGRSAILH